VGGFNYEFGFGLGLGYSFYGGLIDIIQAEKVVDGIFSFNLGYNFAKLLDYLSQITS